MSKRDKGYSYHESIMAELVKMKPKEEQMRFIAELSRVVDEIDAIYDRYAVECDRTREQFPCIMTHLIFPSLRKLYRELDKLKGVES